jgi:hypothetical protein
MVYTLGERLPGSALQYGLASYDDYAYGSMGYASSGDLPFKLGQQVTADTSAVQAGMDGLSHGFGGDGPDSAMEALYQSLTGAGYDQNCDGIYEPSTDILPFIASATDPFSGSAGGSSSASGGVIGGLGFREYAKPLIIYITDNYMRDPDEGYESPGGCPHDAGGSDVAAAADTIGATLVGINFSSWGSCPCTPAMEALAEATDSAVDTDGDGTADELLVYGWHSSSSELRETIVDAVEAVVSTSTDEPGPFTFSEVAPVIERDSWGFVTGVTPSSFTGFDPEDTSSPTLRIALDLEGMASATSGTVVYGFALELIGDGDTPLGAVPIEARVPGVGDK